MTLMFESFGKYTSVNDFSEINCYTVHLISTARYTLYLLHGTPYIYCTVHLISAYNLTPHSRFWFMHDDSSCQLLYYNSANDVTPRGMIDISTAAFKFLPEKAKLGEFIISRYYVFPTIRMGHMYFILRLLISGDNRGGAVYKSLIRLWKFKSRPNQKYIIYSPKIVNL